MRNFNDPLWITRNSRFFAFESFVSSSTEKISMFIRLKIDYL